MAHRSGLSGEKQFRRLWNRALPVLFFLFVFFLYFSLLSDPYFTDEEDVFFGGYSVVKGQDVYKSFLSQHMPFSYYFAALIALCGARTMFQFRLGTYLMLTLLWEALFLRNRKSFHPAALFAMPLLYLTVLKTLFMGTTMLSDHWQGIGMVLILLELIRYMDSREITLPCALMVSLGVVLSFGTTFASAYSLFCYFLGVVVLQWKAVRADRKAGDLEGRLKRKCYLREDLRLLLLCLLPFALLMGWYLISGNVANFFSGAYEIVTQVYVKYTGGLGSDPVGVVWDTVRQYGVYLLSVVRSVGSDPLPSLLYLVSALGLLLNAVRLGKRSPAVGVLVFLAAVYGGLRGFSGFHGLAYHAQAVAGLCLLLGEGLSYAEKLKKPARRAVFAAAGAAGLLLAADFVIWAGYNLLYPQILLDRTLRCEERILDLLTDPDEEVFACNAPVTSLDVMDLDLTPKKDCGAVHYPYYYAFWGDRLMASVRDHPHIVIYNGDEMIWNEVFREYAPDFDAFLQENYTKLPQAEMIWVDNGFYPEAARRLKGAGYGDVLVSSVAEITANSPFKYHAGDRLETRFTADRADLSAIRVCAACYHRRSAPSLLLQVKDPETAAVLAEARMEADDIADTFFSRCPMQAELIPGKEYALEITVEQIGGKGDMEFYFTPEGELALAAEYDTSSGR